MKTCDVTTEQQNSKHNNLIGQLYSFCISYFAGISQMFSRNTPQNTKHLVYTFHISCEFRVLLMREKINHEIF